MKKIILKIDGMHCQSCEKIITMELSELGGVSSIKIDSIAGTGELEIDNNLVSEQTILQTIEKAGYKAEITNKENTQGDNGNGDSGEEPPISLEKKTVNSDLPFKMKVESTVEAEGSFSSKNDTPNFEGKVKHHKKGEFEVPQGREDIDKIVENLIHSSKIKPPQNSMKKL